MRHSGGELHSRVLEEDQTHGIVYHLCVTHRDGIEGSKHAGVCTPTGTGWFAHAHACAQAHTHTHTHTHVQVSHDPDSKIELGSEVTFTNVLTSACLYKEYPTHGLYAGGIVFRRYFSMGTGIGFTKTQC